MPPARTRQRSLRPSSADAAPYRRKAKDRRIKKDRKIGGDTTASLSDGPLACIFAALSDTAAVVRCAATCRRWERVVATSANIISRSLPPLGRFLPDLTVGLFHQEMDMPAAASSLPCFVPTASAARFLGEPSHQRLLSVAGLGGGGGGRLLDHSRPVASRNGRLVLELRRSTDGLRLAVCNPMLPDSIVELPPLISAAGTIQDYGCALLTGQDLRPPRCNTFFRLLLVYNHNRGTGPAENSTVLRCYSSDTGCWGREAECCAEIPSSKMCNIGQSVVRRGVAFWPLDLGALGARLDQMDEHGAVMDMHLVPYEVSHWWPEKRLLGVSSDDRLFFFYIGVVGWKKQYLLANLSYFEFAEEDNIHTGRGGIMRDEEHVSLPQMKMSHATTSIKLRWFGEKSGIVLFTMGRPSGHKGTFAFNLQEKMINRVAIFGDSWKNLLGYEMDMAAYLASLERRSDLTYLVHTPVLLAR